MVNKHSYSTFLQRIGIRQNVIIPPKPLLDHTLRLGLLWSAKAGCTFSVKWFFHHSGLLEEALEYDPWIHNYRKDVYNQSSDYRETIKDFLRGPDQYTMVKLVRDPYDRAVSSFIHAAKHEFLEERMSTYLGRSVDQQHRFSFDEFVGYLETINLRKCNPHHRIQVHEIERKLKIKLRAIRLDHSFQELEEIEKELGLPISDKKQLNTSNHHTVRQFDERLGFVGETNYEDLRKMGNLPVAEQFYNEALRKRVAKLYQEDFERYGFEE